MDIEAKLNMSLDDLMKKDKYKQSSHHRRGAGGDWRREGNNGYQQQNGNQQRNYHQGDRKQGGPQRRPQQQQQGQSGQHGGQQGQQGAPVGGYQQQQQWGQQQKKQQPRLSVFARLSGTPQPAGPSGFGQQQCGQGGDAYQRQQQQQQQGTGVVNPSPKLQCRLDKETGQVVITHNRVDIIKVGPAGDVVLDSGGDRSTDRLYAFNKALSHINVTVKLGGNPEASSWSVSDGKGLVRFSDGMMLPAKGHLTAGRAMVLLQAFAAGPSKAAAAAAQQASMQAAIEAGILPANVAAGAAVQGAQQQGTQIESAEAAQIRRLQVQGRYQPY